MQRQNELRRSVAAVVIGLSAGIAGICAASDDVAKQLANPIASLVSVPLQLNYDEGYGASGDGELWRLNVQPVIPFSAGDDWNVISRTILPLVEQDGFPGADYSETGLGDTLQSLFFSPKALTENGWTWGVGPALLLPTATDDALGAEQWAAGPTAVALRQSGSWTYGALANHIESFAGDGDRSDVSATFLQPFLTYITSTQTTFAINTESTYDWETEQWSVPLNLQASQLLKLGGQLVQVGGGVRYWLDSPRGGPDGWGLRMNVVLVFPRS